jgi:hypothetical protein
MDPHSQIVDAFGHVRLEQARDASLSGVAGSKSANIDDLLVISGAVSASEVSGSSFTDIAIPVSLEGLRTISILREGADAVGPALHGGLPGLGQLAFPYPASVMQPKISHSLQLEARYASAMAELASGKGAPASTRTLLAWCAYRLRNATASSRIERMVLSAYRVLGYGERFAPAFAAFILAAVALNVAALHGRPTDWDGVDTWFLGLADWLLTPLHILNLTDSPKPAFTFEQPWDALARLAVALPFAVSVLALRKFVKR